MSKNRLLEAQHCVHNLKLKRSTVVYLAKTIDKAEKKLRVAVEKLRQFKYLSKEQSS